MRILSISLFAILMTVGADAFAGKKKVNISCSEQDAEIYVNGEQMGRGSFLLVIPSYANATVTIKKTGYFTETITFFNTPGNPSPPKSYHFKMFKDDAYEASVQTDIANLDLEIKTARTQDDAWMLLNTIVLNYIDVIEVTDKETAYLRTAWQVQNFSKATIRTRVIIKMGAREPLSYKMKLVSEIANAPNISPKEDQAFKEWDRVLRKYEGIVTELPSRMK
jgi:hypothetical protein